MVAGTCVPKVQLLKPFSDRALQPFGNRLICARVENWPTLEELAESMGAIIFILFGAIASTAAGYGGFHGTANRILFPTAVEYYLWDVSCFALFAYILLFAFLWGAADAELKLAKGSWIAEARVAVLK
jgi:hypothetical protein